MSCQPHHAESQSPIIAAVTRFPGMETDL